MDNIVRSRDMLQNEVDQETILIKKAIGGNHQEFIRLVAKYKPYMYRIAYAYVKNEDKAKEIIHDCTYKAFLGIKNLKKPDYFKTWLTRILINEVIRTLKKESKFESLEDNSEILSETEGSSIEETLDLYNAIDMLKSDYKTAIILKYFNDLSIENVALIMEVPVNTVKTYLRRARHCLAGILKEGYLDEQ